MPDKTCPECKEPVKQDDFIYCTNEDCSEYNLKYLPHEFNELEDSDDERRNRGVSTKDNTLAKKC